MVQTYSIFPLAESLVCECLALLRLMHKSAQQQRTALAHQTVMQHAWEHVPNGTARFCVHCEGRACSASTRERAKESASEREREGEREREREREREKGRISDQYVVSDSRASATPAPT